VCSDPIPGLTIVAAVGPTDSLGFQGVPATCPAGKNLIGGGGRILDGQGKVSLVTHVEGSTVSPIRYTAGGLEELGTPDAQGRFPGFPGNWSVIAYAVCVPLALRTDIEVVKVQTAFDPSTPKLLTAACPIGKRVTGGGGWANPPAVVNSMNIDANRTRIQVIGRQHEPIAAGWDQTAEAICVA
jgi:hypothetical protein